MCRRPIVPVVFERMHQQTSGEVRSRIFEIKILLTNRKYSHKKLQEHQGQAEVQEYAWLQVLSSIAMVAA